MKIIIPFANESDSISIGAMSIENRTDRISLYGSTDITRDKAGLEKVRQLKELIDSTFALLEAEEKSGALLDAIHINQADEVKNPFN